MRRRKAPLQLRARRVPPGPERPVPAPPGSRSRAWSLGRPRSCRRALPGRAAARRGGGRGGRALAPRLWSARPRPFSLDRVGREGRGIGCVRVSVRVFLLIDWLSLCACMWTGDGKVSLPPAMSFSSHLRSQLLRACFSDESKIFPHTCPVHSLPHSLLHARHPHAGPLTISPFAHLSSPPKNHNNKKE